MHSTRVGAAILLLAMPLLAATPAGASNSSLKPYVGPVTSFQPGQLQFDGSCPKSADPPGRPRDDAHQLYNVTIAADGGTEHLGMNLCWYNSTAELSGPLDRKSTFVLSTSTGSFRGTVTGGWHDAPAHPMDAFTLTITHVTGRARGLTGSFFFHACDGYPNRVALRVHVSPNLRCPI